jgi:methionyl-tRNA formyltransferase
VRTVFLGTSEFAAAVLARLAGTPADPAPHRPVLVLTRPNRPAGRGRKLTPPPVAEAARALGLPLAQPERVNDPSSLDLIADASPEVLLVCAFGALIKEPLLSAYVPLNVHPSLLPRWRGAAPIERAIMAGDPRTGVSIMRLTAGLDSGPICAAAQEPIHPHDTYGSLAPRLQRLAGDLLAQTLDALSRARVGEGELEGEFAFAEQDERLATYAEKIDAPARTLDPHRPAVELERVVRALHPHIGARVALPDGTLLGVHRAAVVPTAAEDIPSPPTPETRAAVVPTAAEDAPSPPTPETRAAVVPTAAEDAPSPPTPEARAAVVPTDPEDIPPPPPPETTSAPPPAGNPPRRTGVLARDGRLLLTCSPGALELLEVQPPGKRPMDAASYLRGHAG